jgi:TPP-dependent pyruvate/acetoin dehydrogenase alpha subunit
VSTRQASQETAARPAGDREQLLEQFSQMLQIRLFEEEIHRLFLKGEVHGTTHLCIGHEAVSVGVAGALRSQDYVAATYRGHGHALANGVTTESLAAEMLGRATGTCGGRAGSMNVIDLDHRLIGCFGIVGGSMGAATGAAMTAKRNDGVAVAFFGDGATNQAYFAECLNFAKVHELPLVFVCENNLYGEYTPMAQVTAGGDISARAATYDLPVSKVDGNDVRAVRAAAETAVEHARQGNGPAFLECLTYRHLGHSRSDPGLYRPKEEVEAWLARDPIPAARKALEEEFSMDAAEVFAAEEAVRTDLNAAFERARNAPFPEPTAVKEYCP